MHHVDLNRRCTNFTFQNKYHRETIQILTWFQGALIITSTEGFFKYELEGVTETAKRAGFISRRP